MDPNFAPDVLQEYARVTSPIPMATDTSLFGGTGPTQPDLNVGPAPPVADVPAAPQAPTPAGPPAAAPSSVAPSIGGQPQQSKEGKSWQDYSINLMQNPETAAMVIAIGAALGSTRFRTPQERLSGAFITGMSALGATYGAQQKRLESEGKISSEAARANAATQEAGAAVTNAQTNQQREGRLASEFDTSTQLTREQMAQRAATDKARLAISSQELQAKRDELAAHVGLWRAQAADLADAKTNRAAKLIIDSGQKAVDNIYKNASASGEAVDATAVQKQADAVMEDTRSRLQQLGVSVPGIQNPALERVRAKLRALNPTATDEQIDKGARAAIEQSQRPPVTGPGGMQAGPH